MTTPFKAPPFPYTLFHDDLGPVICQLRGSSVKLLYFIMKRSRVDFTHFEPVQLSYSEMLEGSGISSRTTIRAAIEQLIEYQIMTRIAIGHATGIQDAPLYEYTLNLDYETPIPGPQIVPGTSTQSVPTSTQSVPTSTQSVPTSTQSVPGTSTESVPASTESVPGTSTESVPGRDQIRSEDDEDILHDLVDLGLSQSAANKLLHRYGAEAARQWWAFVADPRNGVKSPGGYLFTACLRGKGDPPPIDYTPDDMERVYWLYEKGADALERASYASSAAPPAAQVEPEPEPENDVLGDLWRETLQDLRQQMTQQAFDQWLHGSTLIEIESGSATVKARDAYAQEWLQERWAQTVLRTLAAMARYQLDITLSDIKFVCGDSIGAPGIPDCHQVKEVVT